MRLPSFLQPKPARLFAGPAPHLEDTPTVLLVDDEPAIRALLAASLRRVGYGVLEAGNGAEAVALARETGRLDVVVSDIHMPRMDGFDMATALRESRPELNIVFVSGYTVDHARVGPRAEVLTKPFLQTDLLRAVERAAPRVRQPAIPA